MKYSYDTTQNKIDFLTALLARLKHPQARWRGPWLCVIANFDMGEDESGESSYRPEYKKFIQDQLIEDGKLTMDQAKNGAPGFGQDQFGVVPDGTRSILFSTRIQYLEEKIKFFQDQLKKESKMQYKFKIGDIVEFAEGQDTSICKSFINKTGKLTRFEVWAGKPAYRVNSVDHTKGEWGIFLESEIQLVKKKKHIPIGKQYQKTIDTSGWSNEQFNRLHRGQWVNNFGATGQFLGITARGTVTVNYKQTKDARKQYAANKPLRQFVKLHGGK